MGINMFRMDTLFILSVLTSGHIAFKLSTSCLQVVCGLALKKALLLAILNAERITQRLSESGAIRFWLNSD